MQGAPIASHLLESHGSKKNTLAAYHSAMYYAGSLAAVAMVLVGIVRMYEDRSVMRRV